MKATLLLILLTSCATYDFNQVEYFPRDLQASGTCSYYGVREGREPMGDVVVAAGVSLDLVEQLCAGLPLTFGETVLGCALYNGDGTVSLYWRAGDIYIENHERCHAIHGVHHNGVRI
jgi:hypothetical protein